MRIYQHFKKLKVKKNFETRSHIIKANIYYAASKIKDRYGESYTDKFEIDYLKDASMESDFYP